MTRLLIEDDGEGDSEQYHQVDDELQNDLEESVHFGKGKVCFLAVIHERTKFVAKLLLASESPNDCRANKNLSQLIVNW